ncbi:putative CoA-substrate-specific enzyme activase [Candidatus Methanoperedens nitroreducens]|uniref:Putative CoA-substrate-specific enzyme activase n=1 Tax=Candidatus Methanoperedens nitratireducens TaxID=1392998 RepID=A0A062V5J0_9EURY|nr:acyl-CoA dehydratase activase [Candidatus Methanoperedens nitroreducens]KCZ70675.1 putative CoA-substrate-specific enzyme activase [Candidatus Methanoperedens nitroreducens]MDJ1420528.1 acyl-CoA dehydratase activase [Candidatus Methanoperedens sp.]
MIGLDVGSTTAKIVKIESGEVKYQITSTHNWKDLVKGIEKDDIISTGYFRNSVPHRASVTEITAAIYGVSHYFSDVDVIVDIGGQDTKVIDVKRNNFIINDKCSAGTGAFLEFIAGYFRMDLDELGRLHLKADRIPDINNTCGVFAISEMISQLVAGYSKEEVIAGMHYAFARRVSSMIPQAQIIVLIGGTVKNEGMVMALRDILKKKILIPTEPQIINALGALKYYC